MRKLTRLALSVLSTAALLNISPLHAKATKHPAAITRVYKYIDAHITEFKYTVESSLGGKKDLVFTYGNPYLRIARIIKQGLHGNHVHYTLNGRNIEAGIGEEIFTYLEEGLHTLEATEYTKTVHADELDSRATLDYLDTLLQGAK